MNRMKFQKIFFPLIIVSLLLLVSVSKVTAARSWNAGDVIYWGEKEYVKSTYTNEDNEVAEEYISSNTLDRKFNITSIDIDAFNYEARITTTYSNFMSSRSFDPEDFFEDELEFSDFFSANYVFDDRLNVTELIGFDFDIDPYYLLEPK
ncbi:MAG: hypothetical protein U9O98_01890 [Asgard group archaeon]|nr:hypothetical protein [Asgard group archaeon]